MIEITWLDAIVFVASFAVGAFIGWLRWGRS